MDHYKKGESVGKCLLNLDIVQVDDCKVKQPKFKLQYKFAPLRGDQYAGVHTKMRSLLTEVKSGDNEWSSSMFQGMVDEFKETRYSSYWSRRLGRSADSSAQLPPALGLHRFGITTNTGGDIEKVVYPDKWRQFQEDDENNVDNKVDDRAGGRHRMYVKSHMDYYAGEQMDRGYANPRIDKRLVWGKRTKHEKGGRMLKEVMRWNDTAHTTTPTLIQADFNNKNRTQIGKGFAPNRNIDKLPEGYRFGKVLRDKFRVLHALRSNLPSKEDDEVPNMEAVLTYLNSIRNMLSKRSPPFPHVDLIETLKCKCPAQGIKGWASVNDVCEACSLFNLKISKQKLEEISKYMNITNEEGLIDYKKFIQIISPHHSFPKLRKLEDIPAECLHFTTDYREMTKNMQGGGMKSEHGLEASDPATAPPPPDDGSNALEAVSPSICTQYGVNRPDVIYQTRGRQAIRKFFLNVDENTFETVWDEAERGGEGKVSIATFKEALERKPDPCVSKVQNCYM